MSLGAEIASGEYAYLTTVWIVSQNYGVEKTDFKTIKNKTNNFLDLLRKNQ